VSSLAHSLGRWSFDVVEVLEVHDGDTIHVRVDVGFEVDYRPWIRIRRASSPELNEPGGPEARDYLASILAVGRFTVTTFRRESGSWQRSFVRWIGDVSLSNGEDVAVLMVQSGHAKWSRP